MAKKKKKKTAIAAALEKIANKKTAKKAADNKTANKQKTVQKQTVQKKQTEKKSKVESAKKAVAKSQQKNALGAKKGTEKKTEKKTNKVEAAKKAANKGLNVSGLGTEVKTHTKTYKDKEGNKTKYTYTDLNREDYGKMTTASMTGQMDTLMKSDKKLAKKVADVNVKDYVESPGVMGALDQMTQGRSVSENPVYDYSKDQKKIIKAQKETGKYTAGRVVGAVAEFGLGGTGTIGSSIAKTGGKAVLKEAAEQGGKALAKQTAKNIAKETAGDVVASAGLNTLDALKFSYKDGEFDKKTFAKELALNIGGDILIGGAVSGISHGLSAKQVSNFNKITKKKAKGEAVSEAEQKFYDKHLDDVTNKVQDRLRQLKEEDAKKTKPVYNSAEKPQGVEQVAKTTDEVPTKVEQPKTEESTVAKSATTEQPNVAKATDEATSPTTAKTDVDDVDPNWKTTSEEAANNPGKQFDNAKEKIFDENKNAKEFLEKSKKIAGDELPRARQTAKKLVNQSEDDVADIIEPWVRDGYYNKKVLQSQKDARAQALAELNDGTLYRNFMDSKVETDEHLFMARAEALLNDLMKRADENDDVTMQLLEVMDKATDASSHAGRLLNATKLLLRNTPEGRVRMVSKELERLNKKFADRLGGKKIELSEEQINRIRKASDDEIEDVVDKINLEIWEEIPATWFEKFNEIRHASMLFNAKTHFRNMLGNSVFWGGRLISDAIEIAAYKMPGVKKRLEKLGGNVQMVHVTRKELADNKKAVNDIFDSFYKKTGGKNKYIETSRPDGTTAVKNKAGSWIIQKNYNLLEKEDMITFKPEYRKNFIRWCKTHNVDLSDIPNMSKKQMREANAYAMNRAQRATFRDDSAFAEKIVGWKNTTATKKGKTPVGTAMYRAGNVALESSLPFVKTPVNILRRSVDYSPIGLARGAAELMTAKNADVFMEGVTHMASGLTGTGVFALGMWLANRDLITVKAGEESGDAFYDRDMGYQDYSLVLGFGDKDYSLTIDWVSPMQVSLFMGANAFNNMSDKNLTLEEMLNGVLAISGPMLDMSFMSSTKDTIETFMEKVYRNGTGEDADWTGAIMKTLFGSVPQGYLSGFVPQLMSQTATALDSKQRDTRSTLEDPIASSWDSFAKKLANKVPVLRNKVLNPKIDRFGEDVVTGNNIVTRLLSAYASPSTVKEIKRTDFDNKIIDIYNHLEDGSNDKKYFYYNFTGNPSYDLGDDKRMSYDELYKYGKANRIEQTKTIQAMFDSASYKNMTWNMRASEVDSAHWIGQTHADQKTYGSDFALDRIIDGGSEADSRAAKVSKQVGVSSKEFVDFYITKEKLTARSHDSDWNTKALAVALSGNDKMAELYKVNADKVKIAKEYLKKGGSAEEYSTASCNIVSKINKADVTDSKSNRALAAAYFDINKRTYTALGFSSDEANMGVGLKKMGYDFEKLSSMKIDLEYGGFDADKNGSSNKQELIDYIESLGIDETSTKACLFEYLCTTTAKNPYGSIPKYLGFGNSGSSSGGGSGSGKSKSDDLPSWEEWVKDYLKNDTYSYEKVEFKDWDSPIDSAYRKKITSLNTK